MKLVIFLKVKVTFQGQMDGSIGFRRWKSIGIDMSLIILVISEIFQDGGSAAILDWLQKIPPTEIWDVLGLNFSFNI